MCAASMQDLALRNALRRLGGNGGRRAGGHPLRRRRREGDGRGGEGGGCGDPEDVLEGLERRQVTPPTSMVTELRAAATAALEVDVPTARSNVFRPLADAVS